MVIGMTPPFCQCISFFQRFLIFELFLISYLLAVRGMEISNLLSFSKARLAQR